MGGIVLALTIGFLLGVLLMVILAAGRDESQSADHRTTGLQDHRPEAVPPEEVSGPWSRGQ